MKIQSTVVDSHDKTRHGIHNSILECIGRTPVVKLSSKIAPVNGADVYVKLESENPGGSLKDRLAVGIIEWAEQHGKLAPGQTVVEASSGNTGIGLAMVCAAKGYKLVVVMSEAFSVERRKLMRFYGAQVILTSREHKATGMLLKAKALAEEHGFFYCNQFEAEANAWIHEQTTGREIAEAFDESQVKLDHIVIPFGTGGTLAGVSKKIRAWSPETIINACEPSSAPMLYSGIETEYPEDGEPTTSFKTSHPAYNVHPIQGWSVDFIPKILAKAKTANAYDNILHVDGGDAILTSRDLAKKEGILTGISGGGTLAAALKLAQTLPKGTSVLAVVADTGERYMTTSLFDDIPVEMTAEESYLDATTIAKDPLPTPLLEPSPEAIQFVEKANLEDDVVLWCLQHADDSKTMKIFLDTLKMEYRTIYLDDFANAKDNLGCQCKTVLRQFCGSTDLPQLFVGNQLIGGVDATFVSWCNGSLSPQLEQLGVGYASYLSQTPLKVLPEWAREQFIECNNNKHHPQGSSSSSSLSLQRSRTCERPSESRSSNSTSRRSSTASHKPHRSSGSSSSSNKSRRHSDCSDSTPKRSSVMSSSKTKRHSTADCKSSTKERKSWKLPSIGLLKASNYTS